MLLPYMLAGVRSSAVADYRSATYMVIGQLASKAIFSDHLLSGVQVAALRHVEHIRLVAVGETCPPMRGWRVCGFVHCSALLPFMACCTCQ